MNTQDLSRWQAMLQTGINVYFHTGKNLPIVSPQEQPLSFLYRIFIRMRNRTSVCLFCFEGGRQQGNVYAFRFSSSYSTSNKSAFVLLSISFRLCFLSMALSSNKHIIVQHFDELRLNRAY